MSVEHGVSVDQNLCISDIHYDFYVSDLLQPQYTVFCMSELAHVIHSRFVTSVACGILVYTSRPALITKKGDYVLVNCNSCCLGEWNFSLLLLNSTE